MANPRLFLVAPEAPAARLVACLEAAHASGDVASLLVPAALGRELATIAQPLGIAVLTRGEPGDCLRAGCDGLHVEAEGADLSALRQALGRGLILGVDAGASRHLAMEAAEAGADYVALSQSGPTLGGEPILAWWSTLFEIPGVAFEPASAADLDILLPQNPDFIRPPDAMWESADEARRVVAALTERMSRS